MHFGQNVVSLSEIKSIKLDFIVKTAKYSTRRTAGIIEQWLSYTNNKMLVIKLESRFCEYIAQITA